MGKETPMQKLEIKKNRRIDFGYGVTLGLAAGLGLAYIYTNLSHSSYLEKEIVTDSTKVNTPYQDREEFQKKYLEALKNNKVTYTPCGENIPLWGIDINGDKNLDGYILHLNGSTRESNSIIVYPVNNKRGFEK